MEQQLKLFRVFIASPGDLADERRALREVVEKINAIYSKETEWRIELLGWEDTLPGAGRPQELINADLAKADLFIGCLWQRWGSNSGSGTKTGFEEEFDRSLVMRTTTGSPEMWLFFKEVEPVRRSDPGEQLQKVLAFRAREIEAKRLFFKEFRDVAAWRELLSELLQRHMLRLVTARHPLEKEVQSKGVPQSRVETGETDGESPESQSKSSSAFISLAELLKGAEQKIRSAKLAVFDRSGALAPPDSARLLLFAATNYDWNAQHIQLGSHEVNSVYWHRTTLDLTALERLFLLRTILLDDSLTKPGWFWINEWKLRPEIWIPWFASLDSTEGMRETVVDLATRIRFPLYKGKKGADRPIDRLVADQDPSVRIAALRHLAVLGRPVDIPVVARLLQDDDKDVRAQAERTGRLIRLRANPDVEAKKSIEQADSFDEEMANAVAQSVDKLPDETLKIALMHPSGALRAVASKELLKRGNVSAQLAGQMCADEAKVVKECGYLARVALGETLNISEVRSSLTPDYFLLLSGAEPWDKAEQETVISSYFDRLPAEELWRRVDALNEDSHLALESIGRRFFKESASSIRAALHDDFNTRVEIAKQKTSKSPAWLGAVLGLPNLSISDPVEAARKRLRLSALQTLADQPIADDRDLFLKYLSPEAGEAEQTIACLRGLSVVGHAGDREKFVSLFSEPEAHGRAAVARTYLALSPNKVVAAKDLLNQPSKYHVWAIINYALKVGDPTVRSVLEPLIAHEDENIRRLVCYYVVRALRKATVRKLLNDYLARGRYFYNVVTLLDRALYAPAILRVHYSQQEQEFFEKCVSSATW